MSQQRISTETMPDFDLAKFAGETGAWYEISHLGDPFSRFFKGSYENATLSILPNPREPGRYIFSMARYKNGLQTDNLTGSIVPGRYAASKCTVTINSFLRDIVLDFWIYDTDYSKYAIVGGPEGHCFILSRQTQLPICFYHPLEQKLYGYGFAVYEMKFDKNTARQCTDAENKDGPFAKAK